MINQLLNTMYHLNIEIKEIDNKTKLVYGSGILNSELKELIKQHKPLLLQRLDENQAAKRIGFLIYHHGLLYEYRYGRGAFLYIERLPNGKATAWRANYLPDQTEPYKTKTIVHNVLFQRAFDEAAGFIEWINKKRKAG
ncbi:hypothetical protein LIS82_07775 [Cytobacillus solani]|uniref:hypothetical protein n=1 Tax=Cytobacillus solani TaxID=1637975 RepID=UPI0020799FCA|nr:hypothetical protein [Cytobacillus solani]USK56360.1 hypothetical protein LIS82_07775 [Cytobacillus solani]